MGSKDHQCRIRMTLAQRGSQADGGHRYLKSLVTALLKGNQGTMVAQRKHLTAWRWWDQGRFSGGGGV